MKSFITAEMVYYTLSWFFGDVLRGGKLDGQKASH